MAVRTVDLGSVIGPQGPKGATGPAGADGMACRAARFVIGTSQAGWTADDCDYLCDGTDDQAEINAAIQALPAAGGEIVILDGTYNLSSEIDVQKENVTLSGCGFGTKLTTQFDYTSVYIRASNCTVQNLFVSAAGAVQTITITRSAQHCVVQNNYLDGASCEEWVIEIGGSNNICSSNIIPCGAICLYVYGDKNVIVGNAISSSCLDTISGTGNIVANNTK